MVFTTKTIAFVNNATGVFDINFNLKEWPSFSIVSNNVQFIFIIDKYDKLIDKAFGEFINLKVVSVTL